MARAPHLGGGVYAYTSIVDALGSEMTHPLSAVPSTDLDIHQNIELLVEATGSGRAAARWLGVGESTVRGWRRGRTPRGGDAANQAVVSAARLAARNDQYDAGKAGVGELAVVAVVKVSGDSRRRTIHPGRVIPKTEIQKVLRNWSSGEDDTTVDSQILALIDRYYTPAAYDRIERAWFE